MSIFNNYTKNGKGVSIEEAEKRNYFEILFRKFGLIIKSNLLFFGVNIILFAGLSLFVLPYIFTTDSTSANDLIEYSSSIIKGSRLMSPLPFIILALFAPTFAGLTYLCRNFSKQEHVFLTSDFFEHTKKNLKQSIICGIIMSALLYLYLTAFFYYWHSGLLVLSIIISALGIILLCASFYVFPLIVTFELSLKEIFRNALLFAVINLPQNILVLILLSVLHIFLMFNVPVIWLLLVVFFLISFSTYTVNFIAWNAISKHMINQEKQPE